MTAPSLPTAPAADIREQARRIRRKSVEMSHKGRAAHLGSALSCADILATLYWGVLNIFPDAPRRPERDRFILGKGHAAAALYATLGYRGFFPVDLLKSFNADGGILPEHPAPFCVPGLEAATGSLGHGLPIGLGMALASKIGGGTQRVYVLLSDGECNEGSVWEAAMFAPAKGLDNAVAIIDYNRWQATGRSDEVLALQPLKEKWTAFGWSAYEVDGHDVEELLAVLRNCPDGSGKPVAVVARTIKGKGVSFMEDDNNWHYRIPNADETAAALKELGGS